MIFNQKGQTLIEVLVGLSAAVVVIAAITVAVITALNNAEFSRDQNLATQYTQEGMEIIRNMRDLDVASINQTNLPDGTYCLAKGCSSLTTNPSDTSCGPKTSTHCTQNFNNFVREITISHNDPFCTNNGPTSSATPTPTPASEIGTIKVTVNTYWGDTKCSDSSNPFCHSVLLSSCLSDFTIVPTP
ncbi:MAG TPA: hypothetical protein VF189_01140 [Patescibacteria group bacterium]